MKSIEESIHQTKPFKSQVRKALVNIVYSGHFISNRLDQFFSQFGLTHKQYNVLRILRGAKDKISTAQVKERMLVNNADASRIVDRLIHKGLLTKCPNTVDRRQISIGLTELGIEKLSLIDNELDRLDNSIQNMSIDEMSYLSDLLDKLRANFLND